MNVGRVFLVLAVVSLLAALPVATAGESTVDIRSNAAVARIAPVDANPTGPAVKPNRAAWADELDEQIGDTLDIGTTNYDYQHNATVGRMIGYDPTGNDGNGAVHFSYMWRLGTEGRHVRYQRVLMDVDGNMSFDSNITHVDGVIVDEHQNAGYTTLAHNPYSPGNIPVVVYHGPSATSGGVYYPWVSVESQYVPGFFTPWGIPLDQTVNKDWPKSAVDQNNNVHISIMEADTDDQYYVKLNYDPGTASWSVANPSGDYELIANAYFIGYDISVSQDGSRVAVSSPIPRSSFNNDIEEVAGDNDMLVWTNSNYGDDFDFSFSNAVNVTQFQGPDLDALPDTTAANVDTFRIWLDTHVYIDSENTMHAAFPASNFGYLSGDGTVLNRLFYWNETDQIYAQIADGYFFNNASPGVNNLMADRPNLYKDPTTGVLWCIWRQHGEPGDTTDTGQALDTGSAGHPNSDIYISASPAGEYNGMMWYTPINITDTRTMQAELPVGDSRSERDPSIALNNDGDYLNVFYLLDYDGGASIQSEGSETECDMVYQRVPKQQLLDDFEARPLEERFTAPYPLHADSTGFFDYTLAVNEKPQTLQPEQFELEAVYPNPFNSTARVAFRLESRGQVQLTVYDMLGREVTTLVNREMDAGRHEISFLADDLASGVYFVALQSGASRAVQKVALVR